MAKNARTTWLVDEVAQFLAKCPSREELLSFHPSVEARERFHSLVGKSKAGSLTSEEEWELDQFEHLEMLIQSIKARLRTRRSVPS